jgi:hypothetical protein
MKGTINELRSRSNLKGYIVSYRVKDWGTFNLCYSDRVRIDGMPAYGWDTVNRATVFETKKEALKAFNRVKNTKKGVRIAKVKNVATLKPEITIRGALAWRASWKGGEKIKNTIFNLEVVLANKEARIEDEKRVCKNLARSIKILKRLK